MPSSTGRGYDGSNSSPTLTYNMTNSSTNSHKKTESDSLAPSPKPSENKNFHAAVKRTWLETRSKRLWKKFQRSLEQTAGLTPAMTYHATSTTTSDCNTSDPPSPTPEQNNKSTYPILLRTQLQPINHTEPESAKDYFHRRLFLGL